MELPVIQSKTNQFYRIITIVAFLFFGSICTYLAKPLLDNYPIQIPEILFCLVWLAGSLWGFIGIWIYFYKFAVYKDRFEVSNFWGLYKRVVIFSEIKSITTKQKKAKYESWEECVIKTENNRKYKIYSSCDDNYLQIVNSLPSKLLNKKSQLENPKSRNKYEAVIYILMAFGVISFFYFLFGFNNELDDKNTKEIELTLKSKPVITNGTKNRKDLELIIDEYPNFNFNIHGFRYRKEVKYQKLVENTERGDKIILTVDKDNYEQKLNQEKEISFWNKYFNFRHISVYGIRSKNTIFLSRDDYKNEEKESQKWFIVIVFIIIIVGIYEVNASKKGAKK